MFHATRLLAFILLFILYGCSPVEQAPIINGWQHASAKYNIYKVQKDDSLYTIAWAFNLDFKDLASANHLTPPYKLYAGQVLKMSKTSESPATITRATNIKWNWPTSGQVIRHFSLISGGDKGIDIAGNVGQSVNATAAGTVVYSGSGLRGYGNLIIIKHNDQYLSAYAFNQKLLAHEGMNVKAGEKIALMGSQKNTSHFIQSGRLHFEIRQNGKPVNPLPLLR